MRKEQQSLDQRIKEPIKLVYTNRYTTHVSIPTKAQKEAVKFLIAIQKDNLSQETLTQSQETLIDYVLGNKKPPVQPHEVLLNIRPTHRELLADGRSLREFDTEFFEKKCNFDQKIKVLEGYKEKHKLTIHDRSENIQGLSQPQYFEAKIKEVKQAYIKKVEISDRLKNVSGMKQEHSQSPAHILAVAAVTGTQGNSGPTRVGQLSEILGCDFTNKQERDEAVEKLLTPEEYKQYEHAQKAYDSTIKIIAEVEISVGLMNASGMKQEHLQSPAHILAVVAVTGSTGNSGSTRVRQLSEILGCDFTNKQERDEAVKKLLMPEVLTQKEYRQQYEWAQMDYNSNLTASPLMQGVAVDKSDQRKVGVARLASFIHRLQDPVTLNKGEPVVQLLTNMNIPYGAGQSMTKEALRVAISGKSSAEFNFVMKAERTKIESSKDLGDYVAPQPFKPTHN